MNTPNNKRKKDSQEKIEKAFMQLIQTKELNEISITEICKLTKLNRSTFYANYIDIFDLVEQLKKRMIKEFLTVYNEECNEKKHSYNFLKLFYHVKDNKIFYKTYFKLNFDSTTELFDFNQEEINKYLGNSNYVDYHLEFFKAGFNALLKKWLNNDCKESPEIINKILEDEYKRKNNINY